MPADRLHEQLAHSKALIEDRLGTSVEFLSVPYGLVNKRVLSAAREEGYRAVCTSRNWPANLGNTQIGRVSIHSDTDAGEFASLLARDLSLYAARSAREAFLYLPKQALLRLKPGLLTVQTSGSQQ
jgi:peptidoglycan/xylan/chitin deacetylase (PgdA/CDA1 family)